MRTKWICVRGFGKWKPSLMDPAQRVSAPTIPTVPPCRPLNKEVRSFLFFFYPHYLKLNFCHSLSSWLNGTANTDPFLQGMAMLLSCLLRLGWGLTCFSKSRVHLCTYECRKHTTLTTRMIIIGLQMKTYSNIQSTECTCSRVSCPCAF